MLLPFHVHVNATHSFLIYFQAIILHHAWRYESIYLFLQAKADINVGIHPPLATIVAWGKIANPLHPSETRGWELVTLVVVLFSITLITVIARLWARIKIHHNAGLDDVVIVAAMVCSSLRGTMSITNLKFDRSLLLYWLSLRHSVSRIIHFFYLC